MNILEQQLWCNTSSTSAYLHTYVITMTSGTSVLADIVEVEGVGPNPETLEHDGVQRWCDLYPAQPFGRPCGIERWRAAARGRPTHQGGGRSSSVVGMTIRVGQGQSHLPADVPGITATSDRGGWLQLKGRLRQEPAGDFIIE
jgi:hypothetical protein